MSLRLPPDRASIESRMPAVSRFALALFFIIAGTTHFIAPAPYLAIIPSYLPWPAALVALSGVAEILGGIGVCFRPTRVMAGWCLIALLVAVFPANIHAISTGMVMGGHALPTWLLWARLPFQLLFILWVYRTCLSRTSNV
ncbi:MAG: hypothetical protein QOF24_1787 [Verrucomicrobiota bacterium]|jgi:uncharacterized membrane protein